MPGRLRAYQIPHHRGTGDGGTGFQPVIPQVSKPVPPPHAFTMVELVVVVTILLILIGLVVSVSSRAIDSGKQRQAKAVLDILDTAIEQFASDNPLASWSSASGTLPALGLNPNDYKRGYGSFPPHYDWYAENSPQPDDVRATTLAEHPSANAIGRVAWLHYQAPNPPEFLSKPQGSATFAPDRTLLRHKAEYDDNNALNEERYDLENSENLYFFLTQLSSEAKVILDRLPAGTLTNKDIYARKSGQAPVVAQPDAVQVPNAPPPGTDLMEFRDPWGNVISYWVYYFKEEERFVNGIYEGPPPPMGTGRNEPLISPVPVLESAGPDGKFGHRPGIGHDHNNPHPLDDDKALPDNLFSRPPPWKE